ncbi:putative glycolipid-binding domain-containing protein [Streptomyces cellulosae]|uniref:Glycolipid-binding domain-containing protein n=1 Tax=Streptomyces cellulosae TaxID=1968 RepID=A0ABW7XVR1_STRCE
MGTSRAITWDVSGSEGYETARGDLGERALRATGRAVGTVPGMYWIAYTLDTTDDFVTRRLRVEAATPRGAPVLDPRRDDRGHWTLNGERIPQVDGALHRPAAS